MDACAMPLAIGEVGSWAAIRSSSGLIGKASLDTTGDDPATVGATNLRAPARSVGARAHCSSDEW